MATRDFGEMGPRPQADPDSSTGAIAPLVRRVLTRDGCPDVALVDLGKDVSDALRSLWINPERPFQTGGVMDSAWLPGMVGPGGTALSSLGAGNIFVATVDPKKLAKSAGGVLSFLQGKGGKIVGHAPFVAGGKALMPVLAPLMLFVTLSSVMLTRRLNRIEGRLGRLSRIVERMRQLMEAEDYARFETAAEQIDEIRSEFEHHGRFASDAKGRLSLLDRDVNLLRNKYGKLVAVDVASVDDARASVADLNRFYLASLHDIQVDVLQLCLALQEDATHVEHRQSQLQTKVERYCQDFKRILYEDRIGALHRKFKGDLAKSPWNRLPWGARELKARTRNIQHARKDFNSARARIERWMDAFESATEETSQQCIVFYRESNGQGALRAYYTSDLRLQPAVA